MSGRDWLGCFLATATLVSITAFFVRSVSASNGCDPHCSTVRFAPLLPENQGIRRFWGTRITNADPYVEYGLALQALWLFPDLAVDPDHWLEVGVTKASDGGGKKAYVLCGGCYTNMDDNWTFAKDVDPGGAGIRFHAVFDTSKSAWYFYVDGKEAVHHSIAAIGDNYLPWNMRLIATGGDVGGSSNNVLGIGVTTQLRYSTTSCTVMPCSVDFVPEDTTEDLVLHGPPPTPPRYYSRWVGSTRTVYALSDCHLSHSCPGGP